MSLFPGFYLSMTLEKPLLFISQTALQLSTFKGTAKYLTIAERRRKWTNKVTLFNLDILVLCYYQKYRKLNFKNTFENDPKVHSCFAAKEMTMRAQFTVFWDAYYISRQKFLMILQN